MGRACARSCHMRQQHVATSDVQQPEIAANVSRIAASARAAAAVADWESAAQLCARIADDLIRSTTGRVPLVAVENVAVATLAEWSGEWSREVLTNPKRAPKGMKPAARQLATMVRSGAFAQQVRQASLEADSTETLSACMRRLEKDGIDAQRLCWAVINFEAQRHVRLIWHEANKLTRVFPDRSAADLLGWGWQGLHVALRNFEPERGFRFSTYACQRISGAIRDGVRAENPVPKRLLTFQRKVAHAEEELTVVLGRVPELAEVAAKMGEGDEALAILSRLGAPASIDEIAMSETRSMEVAELVDVNDPADHAVALAQREAIEAALNDLPDDDAEIARLMLFEQLSPAEVRERTGASPRQFRQRWSRSREHLAEALADWR